MDGKSKLFRALAISLLTLVWLSGCAESQKHNENLAAQRAVEFAQTVLIEKNFDQGYQLLSDGGKRHISPDKFKDTMMRLHPRGFPTRVTAKEYQAMPGENALWIYLIGHGTGDEFQYRATMETTASGDYKVLSLDSGGVGRLFPASRDKKELPRGISTKP